MQTEFDRRRFLGALVASVVAAGAPLPVGVREYVGAVIKGDGWEIQWHWILASGQRLPMSQAEVEMPLDQLVSRYPDVFVNFRTMKLLPPPNLAALRFSYGDEGV